MGAEKTRLKKEIDSLRLQNKLVASENLALRVKMKQCECYAHGESECTCGAWTESTKEREKAIWNAAIDKAVEVVESKGIRGDINPLYVLYLAEELNKLKENI